MSTTADDKTMLDTDGLGPEVRTFLTEWAGEPPERTAEVAEAECWTRVTAAGTTLLGGDPDPDRMIAHAITLLQLAQEYRLAAHRLRDTVAAA